MRANTHFILISTIAVAALMALGAFVLNSFAPQAVLSENSQQKEQAAEIPKKIGLDIRVQEKLEELSSLLQYQQEAFKEHTQQFLQEQTLLSKRIRELDYRLHALEAVSDTQMIENSFKLEQASTEKNRSGHSRISEAEFGQWMEESLSLNHIDIESTELAKGQVIENLTELPGVNLENMQCGESFCRAVFTNAYGNQPDISSLYGKEPFSNEAFTLNGEDGSVSVYSTRSGVSLEELREQVSGTHGSELQENDMGMGGLVGGANNLFSN